jgi:hypothetical protein
MQGEYITWDLFKKAKRISVRDAIDRDRFDIVRYGDTYYFERWYNLHSKLIKSIRLEMKDCFPELKAGPLI